MLRYASPILPYINSPVSLRVFGRAALSFVATSDRCDVGRGVTSRLSLFILIRGCRMLFETPCFRAGIAFLTCVGVSSGISYSLAQNLTTKSDSFVSLGGVDCTEVSVDYEDDPTLTSAEKLALMDQALQRSLSKYDACQTSTGATASGGAAGGSDGGGGGGGGGGIDGEVAGGSVASSDMSGTEQTLSAIPIEQGENSDQNISASAGDASLSESASQGDKAQSDNKISNGKLPDDIPPADNDSILESQIRQAAINEKDPEIQKKLWNEYRKYKGLPEVK